MTLHLDGGRPAALSVVLVRGNTATLAVPRSALDGSMTPWETPVLLEFTTTDTPTVSFQAVLTDNGGIARWELTPEQVSVVPTTGRARLVAAGQTVAAGPVIVASSWQGQAKATVTGTYVAGRRGQSAYEAWLDQGNTGTVDDFLASLVGPAAETHKQVYAEATVPTHTGEVLVHFDADTGVPAQFAAPPDPAGWTAGGVGSVVVSTAPYDDGDGPGIPDPPSSVFVLNPGDPGIPYVYPDGSTAYRSDYAGLFFYEATEDCVIETWVRSAAQTGILVQRAPWGPDEYTSLWDVAEGYSWEVEGDQWVKIMAPLVAGDVAAAMASGWNGPVPLGPVTVYRSAPQHRAGDLAREQRITGRWDWGSPVGGAFYMASRDTAFGPVIDGPTQEAGPYGWDLITTQFVAAESADELARHIVKAPWAAYVSSSATDPQSYALELSMGLALHVSDPAQMIAADQEEVKSIRLPFGPREYETYRCLVTVPFGQSLRVFFDPSSTSRQVNAPTVGWPQWYADTWAISEGPDLSSPTSMLLRPGLYLVTSNKQGTRQDVGFVRLAEAPQRTTIDHNVLPPEGKIVSPLGEALHVPESRMSLFPGLRSWVKSTPWAVKTGWLPQGDTMWRELRSLVQTAQPGVSDTAASHQVLVRRTDSTVTLDRIAVAGDGTAGPHTGTALTLPVGFRPKTDHEVFAGAALAFTVRSTGVVTYHGLAGSAVVKASGVSFYTDNAWPSSLPGVPG